MTKKKTKKKVASNSFGIYKPIRKWYFTNNAVLYSLMAIGLIPALVEQILTGNGDNVRYLISKTGILLTAVSLLIGSWLRITGYRRYRPLKGVLSGEIIFEKERIIADNKVYRIENLKQIIITNDDYFGKVEWSYRHKLDFDGKMSQGVSNKVTLVLKDHTYVEFNIQIKEQFIFEHIRHELFYYYHLGLLDRQNLYNVIDVYTQEELEEARRT